MICEKDIYLFQISNLLFAQQPMVRTTSGLDLMTKMYIMSTAGRMEVLW